MKQAHFHKLLSFILSILMVFQSVYPALAYHSQTHHIQNNLENDPGLKIPTQQTSYVSITDTGFEPQLLTIDVGTEVIWSNTGSQIRQIKTGASGDTTNQVYLPLVIRGGAQSGLSADSPGSQNTSETLQSVQPLATEWQSGELQPGETYSVTFNTAGVYNYYDALDPALTGQIIVQNTNNQLTCTAGDSASLTPLPIQASDVGYTPGQLGVNESGGATYKIDIAAPPGTSGMSPELAFVYDSRGGNSSMGIGWSLAGLSAIGRCPTTLAQHGFIDGLDFDDKDQFCLDGQLLVAVSGNYGDDGTVYRTENEAFSKVVSYGAVANAPTNFKVWTKAGLMMEYGNTADSRIEAQGRTDVMAWAVNKIEDTKGNYISFSYDENQANGEYYPTRIDYTGNDQAGLTPYNSVQFEYETRPDVKVGYVSGSKIQVSKRLIGVKTFASSDLVREYRMGYKGAMAYNQTRLISLTECNGDGDCFSPTNFEWSTVDNSEFDFGDFGSGTWQGHRGGADNNVTGDFNGDGLTDIAGYFGVDGLWDVNLSSGVSFNKSGSGTWQGHGGGADKNITGDFNGDGLSDIAGYSSGNIWDVKLSSGTNFNKLGSGYWQGHSGGIQYNIVGDFNGDGRTDIAGDAGSGGIWHVTLSSGTNFDEPGSGYWQAHSGGIKNNVVGDFNGDGLTDLAGYTGSNGVWHVTLSTGSSFDGQGSGHWQGPGGGVEHSLVADFNGDGLTDIAGYTGSGGIWDVQLSTGVGFNGQGSGYWQGHSGDAHNNIYGDFNGDGLTDIAGYTGSNGLWDVKLSTGTNFETKGVSLYWQGHGGGVDNNVSGDFNGDGRTDIAGYTGTSDLWDVQRSWDVQLSAVPPHNFLTKITNGHDLETEIRYRFITNPIIYMTVPGLLDYPEFFVQAPFYVVAWHKSNNGIGGQAQASYKYANLKAFRNGRGPAGFRRIEVTDEQTGITTKTYYHQEHPFKSMVRRTEQYAPDGTMLNRQVNAWAVLRYDSQSGQIDLIAKDSSSEELSQLDAPNVNGITYFPYIQSQTEEKYELDGSLVMSNTTHYEYDAYGNPTKITTTANDGYQKITENSYDNDTSNWHLGRLLTARVTAEAPGQPAQSRTSSFEYDPASGLLIKETQQPGTALRLMKSYQHDVFGNITHSTWEGPGVQPRTTTTTYDNKGRFIVSTTNALGHQETKSYDDRFGVVTKQTGPNGLSTTWEYDSFGRQMRETRADGTQTVQFFKRCQGNCPDYAYYYQQTESSGSEPVVTYLDQLDRVVRQEAPGFTGRQIYVDTAYDERGQTVRISEPYFADESTAPNGFGHPQGHKTTTSYDLLGRPTVQTNPDGSRYATEYSGLTTRITNPKNQVSKRTLDSQGQLIESEDNLGNSLTYRYDAFGNLLTVTDPAGHQTQMTYDLRGRKISMTDPDMGTVSYEYNAFDELVKQTDAKGQVLTLAYDRLGRMVGRTEAEGTSSWIYDTAANGVGKLAKVMRLDGYQESYSYDSYGRPAQTTWTLDGQTYQTGQSYDAFSRVDTVSYPTNLTIQNHYNSYGYLTEVCNTDASRVRYWKADTINAKGQLEAQTFGNGVTTEQRYEVDTGRLQAITSTGPANQQVQDLAYTFDTLGNLTQRTDNRLGLSESFVYDALNRMTSATVTGQAARTVQYDDLGNITARSDVGAYQYDPNRPHAVVAITGEKANSYSYDANGNRLTSNDGAIGYTSFNKPDLLTQGDNSVIISYGPGRSRYKKVVTKAAPANEPNLPETTTTTYYVGGLYEKETANGSDKHIHYITGSEGVVSIVTTTGADGQTPLHTRYLHRDHLDSVDTITNENGNVVERLSFDAWGQRRSPDTWGDLPELPDFVTARGFTGHEMLDAVGLIHMNGRVYDPVIGRFLSADPIVQAPDDTQSLNRYTYVRNNPLSYVDPSGFSWWSKTWKKVKSWVKDNWKMLAAAALTIVTGGWASGFVAGFWGAVIGGAVGGFTGGFVGTLLAGGSVSQALTAGLTGAFIGAVTAGVTFGIGEVFGHSVQFGSLDHFGKSIAHGVVGGIRSKLDGGKFAHGFLSGAVTAIFAPAVDLIDPENPGINPYRTAAAAVVGGTAAELGGGKFANGAVTGAFQRMFNDDSKFSRPTKGKLRGKDRRGDGSYGASRDRGKRKHLGVDYKVEPGGEVYSPITGKVVKFTDPYGDRKYSGLLISGQNVSSKMFYFSPLDNIVVGTEVKAGQLIGYAQDLTTRYSGITNHVHLTLKVDGKIVNPNDYIP